MLQCQRWHQHSQTILSSLAAHGVPGHHQCRRKLNRSIFRTSTLPPSTLYCSNQARERNSLLQVPRCCYSTRQQNQYVVGSTKPRSNDTVVDISCLSGGLNAHQQSARNGSTRIAPSPPGYVSSKRRQTQVRRNNGPWPGLKVLHLQPAEVSQFQRTEDVVSCPPLLSEWTPRTDLSARLQFPWMSGLSRQQNQGSLPVAHTRLNDELKTFHKYFTPTNLEKDAAVNAWLDLKAIIEEGLGQDAKIDLIGSRASGLDSPTSDLDINVQLPTETDTTSNLDHAKQQLRDLDRHLRRPKFRHTIALDSYRRKATVPIILGTHIPSGLEFQLQSTAVVYDSLEVARAFVAEYPSASTLFKAVKQMLVMRNLSRAQSGGITSYPLLNMVVTSLKSADSHIDHHDIATELLRFLDYWSAFDCSKHKVVMGHQPLVNDLHEQASCAIDPISAIPRIVMKETKSNANSDFMCLEDPADRSNDLGRRTSSMKYVQACFLEARDRLRQSMKDWDSSRSTPGNNQEKKPILAWCLGGDYTIFEEARWQLSKYGDRTTSQEV